MICFRLTVFVRQLPDHFEAFGSGRRGQAGNGRPFLGIHRPAIDSPTISADAPPSGPRRRDLTLSVDQSSAATTGVMVAA